MLKVKVNLQAEQKSSVLVKEGMSIPWLWPSQPPSNLNGCNPMMDPWDDCIYLSTNLVDLYGINVGKYTSPMDPSWKLSKKTPSPR